MKKKVLVTVLTYPTPSDKYVETVCTAGITEDGQWIRIYPIRLRLLKKSLHKYNWYYFGVDKRPANKDIRNESYHSNGDPDCKSLEELGTENHWEKRKKVCIGSVPVYASYSKLLDDANTRKEGFISLATFKPTKILDFFWVKRTDLEERKRRKEGILRHHREQGDLFEEDLPEYWQMAEEVPYTFKYLFEDEDGRRARLSIEDWEVFMLYRNCLEKGNTEEEALKKVKAKYFDDFKNKDLYFFMGTRYRDHITNRPTPFSIIGVFYPPKVQQPSLF